MDSIKIRFIYIRLHQMPIKINKTKQQKNIRQSSPHCELAFTDVAWEFLAFFMCSHMLLVRCQTGVIAQNCAYVAAVQFRSVSSIRVSFCIWFRGSAPKKIREKLVERRQEFYVTNPYLLIGRSLCSHSTLSSTSSIIWSNCIPSTSSLITTSGLIFWCSTCSFLGIESVIICASNSESLASRRRNSSAQTEFVVRRPKYSRNFASFSRHMLLKAHPALRAPIHFLHTFCGKPSPEKNLNFLQIDMRSIKLI